MSVDYAVRRNAKLRRSLVKTRGVVTQDAQKKREEEGERGINANSIVP